jgi:heat shock protein HslJ
MFKRAALLLFLAAFLGACNATIPVEPPPANDIPPPRPVVFKGLEGGTWQVIDINGVRLSTTNPVTLTFGADERVSGKAPCNRYSGESAISTNEIIFVAVVATKMACSNAISEQEEAFFEILNGVVQWRLEDGNILLLRARSGTLKARR